MWPLRKSALLPYEKENDFKYIYGYDCGQLFFKFSPFWVSLLHHEAETFHYQFPLKQNARTLVQDNFDDL